MKAYMFALANFAVCTAIGFIVVCRLNAIQDTVLYRVRGEHACYFAAATLSGFQPWFGEWPGWGSLAMSTSLLIGLLCSAHAWRRNDQDAAPPIASGWGDLRNADGSADFDGDDRP